MFNDKVIHLTALALGPEPLRRLLEHQVAADVHAPGHRVIHPIRLGARFIADEDGAPAPVVELLQVWRCYLHVCDAAEHAQVLNARDAAGPELIGGLATHALGRGSVEQIDGRGDRLALEFAREPLCL